MRTPDAVGPRGVPPDDPRTLATLRHVLDDLTSDGYAYRFQHGDRPLGETEGAFLLCGFMVALAQHAAGREIEAFRWFERNRAAAGSPGLFAEEFDVQQRQLRGNRPKAFVHAMLLETSVVLGR
jgi:GH15 family glucan-1,4-alpha-glucosidase